MLKPLLALAAALATSLAFAAVDVNKADQASLESVKGIGPGLSSKILDERKKAEFKDWDDLMNRVKGVGVRSASRLSGEGLTVNGAVYKAEKTADAKPAAKK